MKFVSNWRSAWKWLSMRFLIIAAVWEGVPLEAKAILSAETQGWITLGLLVMAGLGRMVDQGTEKVPQ